MSASFLSLRAYSRQDYLPALVNFICMVTAFLAIGLCLLFVRTQMTSDTWVEDYARSFRLSLELSPPGSPPIQIPSVSPQLAETLMSVSDIEKVTRLSRETLI